MDTNPEQTIEDFYRNYDPYQGERFDVCAPHFVAFRHRNVWRFNFDFALLLNKSDYSRNNRPLSRFQVRSNTRANAPAHGDARFAGGAAACAARAADWRRARQAQQQRGGGCKRKRYPRLIVAN